MPDGSHTEPPLIEIAIEPKSIADREKLRVALAKLSVEDPMFRVSTDQESGQGFVFENNVADGSVPTKFTPGVEKGLESMLGCGVLAGFPVVDLKVTLVDGAHHEVDSSALAFELATRAALREALQKAGPVLLEPIMKIEVVTPEDATVGVIADLNARRGQIQGQDMRGNANVINAIVPLANMFGYAESLRAMSQRRATFTMRFDHYAPAPLPDDDPPFGPAVGMRA
jgi:elongation factor G